MAEAFSVDQTVFQSSFASSGQRTSAGANEFSESSANAAHVNVAAQQENDARTALLSSVFSRSPDQQNPKFSEVEPFSTADRLVDLSSRRLPSPEFDSIAAELARRSISLDLCLVIPMYNEAKRIAASIKSLAESALSSDRVGFVFVDDGSTDSTVAAARCAIEEFGLAQAQVLVLKANLGKGGAVRAGILTAAASAHYVGYLDADLSLDPSDVAAAFTRMRASDAEVLVGDRIVDATHQPKLRRLASLTFRSLAAMAAPTGVRDTQCAMKLFRANVARNVFEPLQTNGFGFDVEVLVRARAIGARVDELPIAWTHTEGSSVNAAAESYRMMRDVLKVRRALLNG
jgi:dolichyl-phosphate beta-glucosyltransferase